MLEIYTCKEIPAVPFTTEILVLLSFTSPLGKSGLPPPPVGALPRHPIVTLSCYPVPSHYPTPVFIHRLFFSKEGFSYPQVQHPPPTPSKGSGSVNNLT